MAGTEVYSYNLAKALSAKNEVFAFFRVSDPGQREYELRHTVYNGLPVYTVNNTFKQCKDFQDTYSNAAIDKIFSHFLEMVKPDIIHIQHLLFLSLGIVREAKKRGIPVVFTSNDYWLFCHKGQLIRSSDILCEKPEPDNCLGCLEAQLALNPMAATSYRFLRKRGPLFFLRLCKAGYLNARKVLPWRLRKAEEELQKREKNVLGTIDNIDCFIAPSQFMKRKLIAYGVPEEKIVFCQYGIETQRFVAVKKADPPTLKFCFIGTLLPAKGIDLLIRAFKDLGQKNTALYIYGKNVGYAGYEGFFAKLKNTAAEDKRIHFMGEIENNKIASVYAGIDVLIVPSIWYENAPLVIMEALASHIPVLASRIGGIPELIKEGSNGLLFDPRNRDDLRRKLELFFEDPGVLSRLRQGTKALRGIEENAQDMENIYEELLNGVAAA